ncbi:hypothetical protein [Spirillospora sp. CA-294931]|uniref:hypothetical protein n=1 Tax=Spirillospora sp. CA-294931 TaxID=3240042 RepID=UPI003D8BBDF5
MAKRYEGITALPYRPIRLDTTGLQATDRDGWVDPKTGMIVSLTEDGRALTEPYWLDDLDQARHKLACDYGEAGCLIEADPISVGGTMGMVQLFKVPDAQRERGLIFSATIFVAKTTETVRMQFIAREGGITGAREAVVAVKLQNFGQRDKHPYAPEFHSRLPYLRSDDEAWDELFPEHPLSLLRAQIKHTARTARVDPGFAALPQFRGTTRAQGRR